jgi:hypothetical protein
MGVYSLWLQWAIIITALRRSKSDVKESGELLGTIIDDLGGLDRLI